MGVLVYPFDRRDPLGGWQQPWGGVGGREKSLNRAELVKEGMFSVPEEGTRSRAEEQGGCSGCRERQCPGSS